MARYDACGVVSSPPVRSTPTGVAGPTDRTIHVRQTAPSDAALPDDARSRQPPVPAKRKVNYPPARTATRQPRPAGDPAAMRRGPVTIDLDAAKGRPGLKVGD